MKAVIIYSNFASAARANATLQHSMLNADCAVQWSICPWRLDLLKFPPAAGEALADAVDAHLILFVGRFAGSLPFWLHDWLAQWAGCRQIEDAALAMIPEENEVAFPASKAPELSQFAARHGLNLIFENEMTNISGPVETGPSFTDDRLFERTPALTSILPVTFDGRTHHAHREWGINE
jgi:hypothetical protein